LHFDKQTDKLSIFVITELKELGELKPPPRQIIPQNSYDRLHPVVVKIPLKNSWIRIVIRISTKIESFVACRTSPTPKNHQHSSTTFELSC